MFYVSNYYQYCSFFYLYLTYISIARVCFLFPQKANNISWIFETLNTTPNYDYTYLPKLSDAISR